MEITEQRKKELQSVAKGVKTVEEGSKKPGYRRLGWTASTVKTYHAQKASSSLK